MESGAPSSGSLSGFITARHYSRCRRMHVLLASAMRKKHIKLFELRNFHKCLHSKNCVKKIQQINDNPSNKAIGDLENSEQFQEFLKCF